MKGSKVGKIVGWVFLGLCIAAVLALVLGLGLQWLWNQLIPDIFGLPEISYWQAVGLFILCHLLFKGHYGHKGESCEKPPWADKAFSKSNSSTIDYPCKEDPVTEKIRQMLSETPQEKENS